MRDVPTGTAPLGTARLDTAALGAAAEHKAVASQARAIPAPPSARAGRLPPLLDTLSSAATVDQLLEAVNARKRGFDLCECPKYGHAALAAAPRLVRRAPAIRPGSGRGSALEGGA